LYSNAKPVLNYILNGMLESGKTEEKEGSNDHWNAQQNFFTHKLINVFKHGL